MVRYEVRYEVARNITHEGCSAVRVSRDDLVERPHRDDRARDPLHQRLRTRRASARDVNLPRRHDLFTNGARLLARIDATQGETRRRKKGEARRGAARRRLVSGGRRDGGPRGRRLPRFNFSRSASGGPNERSPGQRERVDKALFSAPSIFRIPDKENRTRGKRTLVRDPRVARAMPAGART